MGLKWPCVIGLAVTAVVVVVVVIVVPVVLLTGQEDDFSDTFMKRCLEFPAEKEICENMWMTFEQAYVGKDQCSIPAKNYNRLVAETPFKHPCGKTMFWSKTKDLVHKFTEKRDCYFTLEDTLLGYVLDGQSWCGKNGSNETFTKNCEDCQNSPVNAFWEAASAAFAQHACEEASVMLDGQREEPYESNSFFGGVEVPNLLPSKLKSLTVVLVSTEHWANCTCESLGNLRQDLDPNIGCDCKEVPQLHIETCIEDDRPCGTCW